MRRALTFTLILLLGAHPVYGENLISNQDVEAARHLIQKLQKEPIEHMFCSKTRWENADDPDGVILRKFANFFSGDLLKLFAWIQCESPKQPKPLFTESVHHWDLRYGLSISDSGYGESRAKNIRVLAGEIRDNKRILVKVIFNVDSAPALHTTYTLIRENNKWKIDDIALKGYRTEAEEILPSSKSLKTELQAAYKRAEKKCLQDPVCRVKLSK